MKYTNHISVSVSLSIWFNILNDFIYKIFFWKKEKKERGRKKKKLFQSVQEQKFHGGFFLIVFNCQIFDIYISY